MLERTLFSPRLFFSFVALRASLTLLCISIRGTRLVLQSFCTREEEDFDALASPSPCMLEYEKRSE